MATEPQQPQDSQEPQTPAEPAPPAADAPGRAASGPPQRDHGRGPHRGGGGGGRGGPHRGGPGRGGPRRGREDSEDRSVDDALVKLYRCATVVKGGRRFSFGALVVVGDRKGQVGLGYGKANEVPPAVEKGGKIARRHMFSVPLRGTTIPHRVTGRFGASTIVLIPAAEGTGVIAGSTARAVLDLAGVQDVLTKCYGSTSPKNLVKATIDGLKRLRSRETVERLRGVTLGARKPQGETAEAAAG